MKLKKVSKKIQNECISILVSKLIEDIASNAHEQFGINPIEVVQFDIFTMDYFNNTPNTLMGNWNWVYARDSGTHTALVYNKCTNKIKLINKKEYWYKSYFKIEQKDLSTFKKIKAHTEKRIASLKKQLKNKNITTQDVINWSHDQTIIQLLYRVKL
jgi:hydroxymethylpyrimidine pyrophosphatase-like HAD family hydrolase